MDPKTTRTRSRGNRDFTTVDWTVYNSINGVTTYVSSAGYQTSQSGITETIQDSISHNWKVGENIVMNDCLVDRIKRSFSPASFMQGPFDHDTIVGKAGSWTLYEGDFASYIESAVAPYQIPVVVFDFDNYVDNVLLKAYSKIDEATVISGEIIKDLDQTVGMLRRPFSRATDLAKRMLTSKNAKLSSLGRKKTARSVTKAISDTWLEYRYGWKPLIMDAGAIMKTCNSKSQFHQRRVVRAGIKSANTTPHSFVDIPLPEMPWKFTGSTEIIQSLRASAGVIFDLKNRSSIERLEKVMGGRTQDIPITLWEMTPYSFVVDWFSNVGNWLQAITPNPFVTIRGHWATVVHNRVDKIKPGIIKRTANWPPTLTLEGTSGSSEVEKFQMCRVCNQELPTSPVVNVQIVTALRSADAVALSVGKLIKLLTLFARH